MCMLLKIGLKKVGVGEMCVGARWVVVAHGL